MYKYDTDVSVVLLDDDIKFGNILKIYSLL